MFCPRAYSALASFVSSSPSFFLAYKQLISWLTYLLHIRFKLFAFMFKVGNAALREVIGSEVGRLDGTV
jgi:hypothetical protein